MTQTAVPVLPTADVERQTGVSFKDGRAEQFMRATQLQRKTEVLVGGRLGFSRSQIGDYKSERPPETPQSI